MSEDAIVVVGGGHAGMQLCAALAAAGAGARVQLVCEEPVLPYHRPPLSKTFLQGAAPGAPPQRPAPWFAQAGIQVHGGDGAIAIDRPARRVLLRSGRALPYGRLVLATGARPRALPGISAELSNVAVLRSQADALRLRALIASCARLTIVGGGFIGLEVAATARGLGKEVCVLEAAGRLLERAVSPEISQHLLYAQRQSGVDVRLGARIASSVVAGGRLASIEVSGVREPVDVLLLAIGAVPEQTLAAQAGLACANGILVDAHMVTSDAAILAIGDCAAFPAPDGTGGLRLESIQNAGDQARCACATLMDAPAPYRALPWFWSDQGDVKLQIAGLAAPGAERHLQRGADGTGLSVLHYAEGRLVAVESINASADHMAARTLLAQNI